MKKIKKVAVTPIDPITGSIVDGTNIDNKEENTYSAEIIDGLVKEKYSTTETVIGTWIDGKTIYRKIVDFGALPNTNAKSVSTGVSNIDTLIKIGASSLNPTSGDYMYLPYAHTSGLASQVTLYININDNLINIRTGNDRSGFTKTYVIMEYTKTTD